MTVSCNSWYFADICPDTELSRYEVSQGTNSRVSSDQIYFTGRFCLREIRESILIFIKNSKMAKEVSHFWSTFPNDSVYRSVSVRCGYMVLNYDKCFLQRANSFSSNEMTHKKRFTTMMLLHASRDIVRR